MTAGRTTLGWSDLRQARVGVWGLGKEGQATVRKLRTLAIAPVLVDDIPNDSGVLSTADGGLAALKACEVVIKTPGISPYCPEAEELRAAGVTLAGGLGLWVNEADLLRVVYVTGTKGKSTTSSVIGHLLRGLGRKVMVGGNFGAAPYDPEQAGDFDFWVIEVSSYSAADLAATPPVTAVTSLHPDHLPWHGSVERYYADKLSATAQPGAVLTVANGDSTLLRERAALLAPTVAWVSDADEPGAGWMDRLGLPGRHNRRNALIARRVLMALRIPGADDDGRLGAAADGFAPLPSRLTPVGTVDGVTFIDDSLSTNVLPTLAALESFPGSRVALIVGGQDRGIDYAPLAQGVRGRQEPTVVLTLPDSGPRIAAAFATAGTTSGAGSAASGGSALSAASGGSALSAASGGSALSAASGGSALSAASGGSAPSAASGGGGFSGVIECQDMRSAVGEAYRWARPDGIVLLSPAAPSFGRFRDYRDRGDQFAAAMRALS